MAQQFAVGDRVIVTNAHVARVSRNTVGTVVRVFAKWLEMCDVQFDNYTGPMVVLMEALAPAPADT
jgi:hypothetical protein